MRSLLLLICLHKNTSTHTETLHQLTFEVPAAEIGAPRPGRARVPIWLPVPAALPASGESRGEQGRKIVIRWTLECRASVDGIDFHGHFPIAPTASDLPLSVPAHEARE